MPSPTWSACQQRQGTGVWDDSLLEKWRPLCTAQSSALFAA